MKILQSNLLLILLVYVSAEDISDVDFMSNYDSIIKGIACSAMEQKDSGQMKVNISRYSTYEEMTKLTFWNMGYDFTKQKVVVPSDIKWKRDLIDTLFDIFKSSCGSNVPHPYLNIFRELAIIYLNSVDIRTSNSTLAWQGIQEVLDDCKADNDSLNFYGKGNEIVGILGEGDQGKINIPLFPPQEKADIYFKQLDMVVDNLWWVFSHAMGKCYRKMEKPAIIAPRLKTLFIRDILKPLINRWGDPGPNQNFATVIGNFNLVRCQKNMRFCVTAAYQSNNILPLQMVRPLKVGHGREGINIIINTKTGATFG